jgi:phosphate transport system ATP-binding protein
MQQAARVSHKTAFMLSDERSIGGFLVEFDDSNRIFTNPEDERTEAYISGRFG